MLNPKQVSEIVNKTLNDIGVKEISLEKLVKGTFVMESGLVDLFDHSNQHFKKRGLMMMNDEISIEVIKEYLAFRPNLQKAVASVCVIDIEGRSISSLLEALESNIKFMVAITYLFYASVYDKAPEDDLHDIARYFYKYYKKTGNGNLDKFVENYKSTFINK